MRGCQRIIEKYPVYFNGQGFYPSIGHKLVHLSLNGRTRKLKEGDDEISGLAVNPAADEIALIVRPDGWDVYAIRELGFDGNHIDVIGGSYGGFMVNWIIGHTNRFRAAVIDRSISDQISFFFTSDIGPRFNSDQMGGDPLSNLDHYWDKSPLKYMKNANTPLLIVHSDEDFRCPVGQAYELFTQLKRQGSKVRMIQFRGENHDLSREGKPRNRVRRLEEIVSWFSENL